MHRVFRSRASATLLLLVAAAVAVSGPLTLARLTAATADPLPIELRYVPPDAAFVLYLDAAKVWSHDAVKSFRAADKETFGAIEAEVTKALAMKAEDVKSVVVFLPSVKQPQDGAKFGLAITFTKPFDAKKLEAGFAAYLPAGEKVRVLAPDDRTVVLLRGLGDEYAKPRPAADDDDPLTPALRAAATGKHALVAGVTFANLPDELRGAELPPRARAFQPILAADALTATVGLGTSLDLDVKVKTRRAAQAADAEKAMAALARLLGDELGGAAADVEKDAAENPPLEGLAAVLKAVAAATKGAKFALDGTEARMTATLPLKGLPLAAAYAAAAQKARASAAAARSANNLKQIALAMHNYHDAYGEFPPAAVCGKKGQPQLSWRVLVLPFIEQEALFKEFKLDEPWDSAHNKKLLTKMPTTYLIPGQKAGATETHYRVFVGNGAAFDWLTGTKITGFTDGTSNTLLCGTGATAVPWTKPDELEFDPEKDPTALLGLVASGRAQVAMADGSVRNLSKLPAKETLKALITRAGGEVIGDDF